MSRPKNTTSTRRIIDYYNDDEHHCDYDDDYEGDDCESKQWGELIRSVFSTQSLHLDEDRCRWRFHATEPTFSVASRPE